ncbi:MAG TPA: hypothetical protein VN726_14435 [Hanamia sp.]|nr:hypothetical protein [Hanamia sp.]
MINKKPGDWGCLDLGFQKRGKMLIDICYFIARFFTDIVLNGCRLDFKFCRPGQNLTDIKVMCRMSTNRSKVVLNAGLLKSGNTFFN